MNKNGFTLVELLAVIAILAILVIIALPNVMGMFNSAKKSSFETEVKKIYRGAEQAYVRDSFNSSGKKTYSKCDGCDNPLDMNVRNDLEYYIEINSSGKIIKYYVKDDSYQYSYEDSEGLNLNAITDIKTISDLDEYDVFSISSTGPVLTERPHVCNSFAEDSWSEIKRNVVDGYTSCYNVGDTRTIEMEDFGSQVIRISNMSTPEECSTPGFSQTACGFVIEFRDIIIKKEFNDNNVCIGAWRDSKARTYLNTEVFSKLPSDLQSVIVETFAVSGHEKNVTNNYETNDKLYLLATAEVWQKVGTNDIGYDSADTVTRQLDYYASIPVTSTSYTGAVKKYNNSASAWWLRSGHKNSTNYIGNVQASGQTNNYYGNSSRIFGYSPAFKIN